MPDLRLRLAEAKRAIERILNRLFDADTSAQAVRRVSTSHGLVLPSDGLPLPSPSILQTGGRLTARGYVRMAGTGNFVRGWPWTPSRGLRGNLRWTLPTRPSPFPTPPRLLPSAFARHGVMGSERLMSKPTQCGGRHYPPYVAGFKQGHGLW